MAGGNSHFSIMKVSLTDDLFILRAGLSLWRTSTRILGAGTRTYQSQRSRRASS